MGFEIALGARVRKSPYFDKTVEDGVSKFSVYNHMYMPVSYGDTTAEYDRLINGVSMWDVSVERQVAIKGPDAEKLARYLTPRNLGELSIGQGRYVPICDHNGTLINDPVLLPIAEDEYWLSIADSDIVLWTRAIGSEKGFDVSVYEPDVSPLAIQGPKAMDVAAKLFGDWVRDLKYFGFRETQLDGIPLIVARSGWSKQGGVELYLRDFSQGGALWDLVKQAGREFGIGPGCPNYIERLESGLVSYGADTDDQTNPYEMGLGKFVNLDRDDDFVGKAALQQIKEEGPKRSFVGFVIDEEFVPPNEQKREVYSGDQTAGYMSSSAYSPRVGANIGVGLVASPFADEGTEVLIGDGDKRHRAKVSPLPFCK